VSVAPLALGTPTEDRRRDTAILLVGTTWMTAALLLHALAGSYATLLACRALAGMAGGILGGVAVAYIGDYFPYSRRGFANGVVMGGFALGQVAGIPIGAVMASRWGFRSPFLALAVFMAVAATLTWARVPQPNVPLATDLSFGAAFRRYRALATRRKTAAAALSYLLMFFGVGAYISYLPTWLEARFHVGGDAVAGMFVVGGVAAILANPASGWLSDRIGRRGIILGGCTAFALVVGATPWVTPVFYASYAVFFCAMGAASFRMPPFQSLFSTLAPASERGSLMSMTSFGGHTGFAIGGAVAGALYGTAGFTGIALVAAAATLVAVGIVASELPEPESTST
jgi:predicted MFS family arabinose efflux permease